MTKTVLCYGDSLTWGWVPVMPTGPSGRYHKDVRWTGVLAAELGEGYVVVEEGLSGRTTAADDPLDNRLNGARYLPSVLASHLPLDLVILMLGTNDAKQYFQRRAFDIVTGAMILLNQVSSSGGDVGTTYPAPRCLLVAPPLPAVHLPDPWLRTLFDGARDKLAEVRVGYEILAEAHNEAFFDAGSVVKDVGVDGLHFSEQNN